MKISSKYIGLITGVLMVIVSLIMIYQFKFPDTGTVKYVCFTIYTIGIVFSLFNYKLNSNECKDLKNYFSEGFKTFVVVTLIMAIFTYFFYKLNPQIFEKTIAEIRNINSLDKDKTPLDVQNNEILIRKIKLPVTIAINTVMYLFLGALITLVGAGFLSQKK